MNIIKWYSACTPLPQGISLLSLSSWCIAFSLISLLDSRMLKSKSFLGVSSLGIHMTWGTYNQNSWVMHEATRCHKEQPQGLIGLWIHKVIPLRYILMISLINLETIIDGCWCVYIEGGRGEYITVINIVHPCCSHQRIDSPMSMPWCWISYKLGLKLRHRLELGGRSNLCCKVKGVNLNTPLDY